MYRKGSVGVVETTRQPADLGGRSHESTVLPQAGGGVTGLARCVSGAETLETHLANLSNTRCHSRLYDRRQILLSRVGYRGYSSQRT